MLSTTEHDTTAIEELPFDEALFYTPEEYLLRERVTLNRHEYHKGRIFPMSGASIRHNIITANLNKVFIQNIRDDYFIFGANIRVHNPRTQNYVYPDITIVSCDSMQFVDDKDDILLNPLLIIEILSKSTESYDRTDKFDAYKGIDSLQEYVLVSQHTPHIEIFTRKNRLEWLYTEQFTIESSILLHSIDVHLPLREVYGKVNFDER